MDIDTCSPTKLAQASSWLLTEADALEISESIFPRFLFGSVPSANHKKMTTL